MDLMINGQFHGTVTSIFQAKQAVARKASDDDKLVKSASYVDESKGVIHATVEFEDRPIGYNYQFMINGKMILLHEASLDQLRHGLVDALDFLEAIDNSAQVTQDILTNYRKGKSIT
jgi:hypothetical protein